MGIFSNICIGKRGILLKKTVNQLMASMLSLTVTVSAAGITALLPAVTAEAAEAKDPETLVTENFEGETNIFGVSSGALSVPGAVV